MEYWIVKCNLLGPKVYPAKLAQIMAIAAHYDNESDDYAQKLNVIAIFINEKSNLN